MSLSRRWCRKLSRRWFEHYTRIWRQMSPRARATVLRKEP